MTHLNYRRVSQIVLALLLNAAMIGIAFLLFTELGNQHIWRFTTQRYPQLQGELVEGSLWNGWRFNKLSYDSGEQIISIESALIHWQLPQILKAKLPVAVQLREMDISSTYSRMAIDNIELAAMLRWNKLVVTDAAMIGFEKKSLREQTKPAQNIQLPDISLPFALIVERFRFDRNEVGLETALTVHGSKLNIEQLTVNTPAGKLTAKGSITLESSYPVDISARFSLNTAQPWLGKDIEARLDGSLQTLQASISSDGTLQPSIDATLFPLQPSLPFNAKAQWQPLEFTNSGEATLSGNLNSYQLNAETTLSTPDEATVKLQAQGNLSELTVEAINYHIDNKQLASAYGKITWKPQLIGDFSLQFADFSTAALPSLTQLNGTVDAKLYQQQLTLKSADLAAKLFNYESTLQASGKFSPHSIRDGKLHWELGNNQLHLSADYDRAVDIQLMIEAPSVVVDNKPVVNKLTATAALTGTQEEQTLNYNVQANTLNMLEFAVKNIKSGGTVDVGEQLIAKLQTHIQQLSYDTHSLSDLKLSFDGDERKNTLVLSSDKLNLAAAGSIERQGKQWRWQGAMESGSVNTIIGRWLLVSPFSIVVDNHLSTALGEQQWHTVDNEAIRISETTLSPQRGSVGIKVFRFNTQHLKQLLPAHFGWESKLDAFSLVQWQPDDFSVAASITGSAGALILKEPYKTPVRGTYQTLDVVLDLSKRQQSITADFSSTTLGDAKLHLAMQDGKLDGKSILKELQLQQLAPLIPKVRGLSGVLSADVIFSGNKDQPLIFGEMMLEQGTTGFAGSDILLRDAQTRLTAHGSVGDISGHVNFGKGRMTIAGSMDWQQMPPRGSIHLHGKQLEMRLTNWLNVRTDTDLTVAFADEINISGTVHVPWAKGVIKQLPSSAVEPTSDVVLTGKNAPPPKPPSRVRLDATVSLGNSVFLDAYGLTSYLQGNLRLQQQPNKTLTANGTIELIKGHYNKFGQDLVIKEGEIVFAGSLASPFISINAIRPLDNPTSNITVGLLVSGTPTALNLQVYSNPDMPSNEQWNYLLQGQPSDGGGSAIQPMLLSLGIDPLSNTLTTVGRAVGLRDLAISTQGTGDATQLTVGGNINKRLRLQYGAGLFGELSELTVRYQLLPQLYVQAVTGTSQAVDLFYRFTIRNRRFRQTPTVETSTAE